MKRYLIFPILLLILASCKDDYVERVDTVLIEHVQMPDTIQLNEVAQINVKAYATNGCWSDLFVEMDQEEDYTYSIKALGTNRCRRIDCICTYEIVELDTIINFQPTQKGTYIFEILKNYYDIKTITDTLIVQ